MNGMELISNKHLMVGVFGRKHAPDTTTTTDKDTASDRKTNPINVSGVADGAESTSDAPDAANE